MVGNCDVFPGDGQQDVIFERLWKSLARHDCTDVVAECLVSGVPVLIDRELITRQLFEHIWAASKVNLTAHHL